MSGLHRVAGYATIVGPDQPVWERDTVACCHCGAAIFVKPGTAATVFLIHDRVSGTWREEPGASCFHCYKPVCLDCHEKGTCTPLEKWLEQSERAGRHALLQAGG